MNVVGSTTTQIRTGTNRIFRQSGMPPAGVSSQRTNQESRHDPIGLTSTNDADLYHADNLPYLDNRRSSTNPFYDLIRDVVIAQSATQSTFYDAPHSPVDDVWNLTAPLSWSAKLFYLNLTGTTLTVYGAIEYGWKME